MNRLPESHRDLPLRLILLVCGMTTLLVGLGAGLARIGWNIALVAEHLPSQHGPLMVSGFLGTLISLERAVALKRAWIWCGPTTAALGSLLMVTGLVPDYAPWLVLAASVILSLAFVTVYRRTGELPHLIMGIGANLWLLGNLFWVQGLPVSQFVFLWGGFLVVTIAGERLELFSILAPSKGAQRALVALCALLGGGALLSGVWPELGVPVFGGAMASLALWLLRYDVARRTIHSQGLTRFIAVGLLSGYVWLVVFGILAVWFGPEEKGYRYDAQIHAFFVGFVMPMIFAHAPVIFSAVIRRIIPFRRAFYIPLAVLHLSLALRVVGDLLVLDGPREWGGLLNTAAILLFLYNTLAAVLDGPPDKSFI